MFAIAPKPVIFKTSEVIVHRKQLIPSFLKKSHLEVVYWSRGLLKIGTF